MFLFAGVLLVSVACLAAKGDGGDCRLASNNAGDVPSQVKDGKEFTTAHLRFRCSGGVATAFGKQCISSEVACQTRFARNFCPRPKDRHAKFAYYGAQGRE